MKYVWLLLLYPLLVVGLAYVALRYLFAVATAPAKALRIAYMIDEAANVALNGQVNTTISARAARAWIRGNRWGCVLCTVLDAISPGHCLQALIDGKK